MLALLIGSFLGLVFLFGGISGAAARIRSGWRSMRLRGRWTTVQAEVLKSTVRSADGSGRGVAVIAQWSWGQATYKKEFIVPEKWWMVNGGLSVPVRVNPDKPRRAHIEEAERSPVRALLLATGFCVMAIVGVVFLIQSAATACDSPELEFLGPICQRVEPYI